VNRQLLLVPFFGLAALVFAQAEPQAATKVGIINFQQAIVATKDGQKAADDLKVKFEPKKKELDDLQQQIAGLQAKIRSGSNTLSEESKQKIARDIDDKTKQFNRKTEDAQAELEQEQQKIINELGSKMYVLISKYAQEHGYSLILDVSNQQTPVLFAANNLDITRDIIDLYDKNNAGAAASPAPAAKPPAAAPAPAVKKPAPAAPAPPK
jgi:outer membrane protein